jgi:hypothetical protein
VTFHEVLDETRARYREPLAFPPIEFEWDGVPVEVHPFAWNACRVTLDGLGGGASLKPLDHWFTAWQEEQPRQGTVEQMSPPERTGASARVTLDLGSAESDAVEHLLDVLARLKPAKIRIG